MELAHFIDMSRRLKTVRRTRAGSGSIGGVLFNVRGVTIHGITRGSKGGQAATQSRGVPCFCASRKYSWAREKRDGADGPLKRAGFCRTPCDCSCSAASGDAHGRARVCVCVCASALIMPAAPVLRRFLRTSNQFLTLPLAMTGMDRALATAATACKWMCLYVCVYMCVCVWVRTCVCKIQ